jgi:hypothetical protein
VLLAVGLGVLIFRARPAPPDPYPWWAGLLIVAAPLVAGLLALPFRHAVVLLDAARPRLVVRPGRLWPRVIVPLNRAVGVWVVRRTYAAKGGPVTYYRVEVGRSVPGVVRDVPLTEYRNPADADALTAWLRERLGLPRLGLGDG